VAALEHSNICAIYDVGRVNDVPYLTMAYIDGAPLSERIAREGPLPGREAAALIGELARALAYAHQQGVVHRDLKPSNVMINRQGRPILMDFGLARRDSTEDVRLTASGAVFGSPAYMAPEQAEGRTDELGPPCDIYGLGVILYEALTGQLPFTGRREALIVQVARDAPPPPSHHRPDLDRRLEAICLKAMAKGIADRYRGMDELAAALAEYLKPPTSLMARRPWPWVAGAALGLAAAGLWIYGSGQPPLQSDKPVQGTQSENRPKGSSPKLDDLLTDLKSPDVIKRAAAAQALGQLSLGEETRQQVVMALVRRVQDNLWESVDKKPDPSKEAALEALQKLAPERRPEALQGAAQSPNKDVAGWARIKLTVQPGIK
jgi:serine/threonine protein kinase